MSEYTITTSSGVFSWRVPPYRCPKHGIVDDGVGTVDLTDGTGVILSKHCMKCYQEWIAANIPQVEEV